MSRPARVVVVVPGDVAARIARLPEAGDLTISEIVALLLLRGIEATEAKGGDE